jgi:long-chain acyl-CoA synthetase
LTTGCRTPLLPSASEEVAPVMRGTGYCSGLEIFDAALERAGDRPAICYFDASISYRALDAMSNALAARLHDAGFVPGDRLAIYMQNVPHFIIGMLAAWKIGGICVPVNPMNREREVDLIFADCRPRALLCLEDLFHEVIGRVAPDLIPQIRILVTAAEFQTRFDPRMHSALQPRVGAGTTAGGGVTVISRIDGGIPPARVTPSASDVALLVYTSGTTGVPKAAVTTHGAYAFNSNSFCEVAQLREGEPILGIAPLFHITGTVACLGSAMTMAAPLILTYRFDAGVVLDAIEEWQPKFVVAAITAFFAIFNHPAASRESLACLTRIYSGGAAVPAPFVQQFEAKFGHYIHNCYGLTETAAPTHIVPFGSRAPVSAAEGALSIGLPAPGVSARLIDDSGATLGTGMAGELVVTGPMVSPGYWRKPEETAASMQPDGFRTGDIAFRDAAGWFYLVDRKKDMIVSSGYKVWPREVEDVLYMHAAVQEAAVVGVADAYRGETVKAFVSLKPGMSTGAQELVDFCRQRMAAYKYPRIIEILAELPKSASGKILRRALR